MDISDLIGRIIYDVIENAKPKPNAMSIKRLKLILEKYIRKRYTVKQLKKASKIPYCQLHITWGMQVRNYIREKYLKITGVELLSDFHISYNNYEDLVAEAIKNILSEYNKDYEKLCKENNIIIHKII